MGTRLRPASRLRRLRGRVPAGEPRDGCACIVSSAEIGRWNAQSMIELRRLLVASSVANWLGTSIFRHRHQGRSNPTHVFLCQLGSAAGGSGGQDINDGHEDQP